MVPAAFDGGASDQIHVPFEYPAQLILHSYDVEEGVPRARIETDQHVDIAVGTEVVPHHRSEQGQLRNLPTFAEGGDPVGGYGDARGHADSA